MITKLSLLAIFALFVFNVSAQSDYSSYLNKAMEKLELGDCTTARKFYNVYKELSGKSVLSVEELISDCSRVSGYKLGDTITVDDRKYTVVYIRDNGQHGYAVLDKGWTTMYRENVTRKDVPTLYELKQIYNNRDVVRMYDIYWTCTESDKKSGYYVCMDFSTGTTKDGERTGSANFAKVLLIHRF